MYDLDHELNIISWFTLIFCEFSETSCTPTLVRDQKPKTNQSQNNNNINNCHVQKMSYVSI